MKIERRFTRADVSVRDQIEWKLCDALITDSRTGEIVFEQKDVVVPSHWSQTAVNILAQKYFRKKGVPSTTEVNQKTDFKGPEFLAPRIASHSARFGGETSAFETFHRLVGHWTYWGWRGKYFTTEEDAKAYYDEMFWMLAMQYAAPNSPQWFNTGLWWAYGIEGDDSGQWTVDWGGKPFEVGFPGSEETRYTIPSIIRTLNSYERPQPHACFIQPIKDDLVNPGGIMDLWVREARLFKHGSGTGTNFSSLRSSGEGLSGGGISSGLMSFLHIGDRAAGAIKSGGTTRRAAKMVCVDVDHPEIEELISWKMHEEEKAAAIAVGSQIIKRRLRNIHTAYEMLLKADCSEEHPRTQVRAAREDGVPDALIYRAKTSALRGEAFEWKTYEASSWEGEAIETVSGQNANNSIRVPDAFIDAVDSGWMWDLKARTDGRTMKSVDAKTLWDKICYAAWACADPGLQFDDTINKWHTCKVDGRINASNPCCFVAGTYVDTSEGLIDIAKLQEMKSKGEELPYAFSFNTEEGIPQLKRITNAWIAGHTAKMCQVVLDNGEEFFCTPEHKWLIRGGYYVEAQRLTPGVSLRKINRCIMGGRISISRKVLPEDTRGNGQEYQNLFMWRQVNGLIPAGYEVHHKNENSWDDRLSNFELIEDSKHRSLHSAGANNGRYIDVDETVLVEVYDAVASRPRMTHKKREGVSPSMWNIYIRKNGLTGKIPQAGPATEGGWIRGMLWVDFVERMQQVRNQVNAKVVEVLLLDLDELVPVFDIEVEGNHNFGIRSSSEDPHLSSVVVSNSEYNFLDNTACNLASLNLVKFRLEDGSFDIASFMHATRLWTVTLDISVHMASYPSSEIAEGTYNYRTLGLGYANLGGLLMRSGIPYDSDAGRNLAASITALMTGMSYVQSGALADELGPFPRWEANKECMREVIDMHREMANTVLPDDEISTCARGVWRAAAGYTEVGFRNAQVTVIAPTGTIGLLMDCDTTGLEPEFSLVKYKNYAGGGNEKFVNQAVEEGLTRLGYSGWEIGNLLKEQIKLGQMQSIREAHLPVFDCAMSGDEQGRYLRPMAHVEMLAAVQPFLSGAASKTINLPEHATVEDVSEVLRRSYELGIKSVALYRNNSKLTQPLNTGSGEQPEEKEVQQTFTLEKVFDAVNEDGEDETDHLLRGEKRPLPSLRQGHVQEVTVEDQTIYIRASEYPDGTLGELFLDLSKDGSMLQAVFGSFAKVFSIALQYGTPLEKLVESFLYTRFEPAGFVQGHESIKSCTSVIDLVARHLGVIYLDREDLANIPHQPDPAMHFHEVMHEAAGTVEVRLGSGVLRMPSGIDHPLSDARVSVNPSQFIARSGSPCRRCGAQMVWNGTCMLCPSCGDNTGCG